MWTKSPFSDQAKKRMKQEKDRVFKVIETKDDNADIILSWEHGHLKLAFRPKLSYYHWLNLSSNLNWYKSCLLVIRKDRHLFYFRLMLTTTAAFNQSILGYEFFNSFNILISCLFFLFSFFEGGFALTKRIPHFGHPVNTVVHFLCSWLNRIHILVNRFKALWPSRIL